jgi:hypothetical protein
VVIFGLEHGERGVGEDGVVAPGGEQLALAGDGLAVERAVMACPLREVNAVYSASATWASETQRPSWSSQMARGYSIGTQASSGMAAIAARTLGSMRTVTEKCAPALRAAEQAGEP